MHLLTVYAHPIRTSYPGTVMDAFHEPFVAADRLAFVFPVYWWSMPALMKGRIERVFTGDWAYQYGANVADRGKEPLNGLLPRVPTALLGVGGSKQRTYDKYGYGEAMQTQLDIGIFAYCGITDVESHLIYDVEGDHNADNRTSGIAQARDIATAFAPETRTPRNAKVNYLEYRSARSA